MSIPGTGLGCSDVFTLRAGERVRVEVPLAAARRLRGRIVSVAGAATGEDGMLSLVGGENRRTVGVTVGEPFSYDVVPLGACTLRLVTGDGKEHLLRIPSSTTDLGDISFP
jgi:hypothetical protein